MTADVRYRPLTMDDAPAVLAVVLAAEAAEPTDSAWDLDEITEQMSLSTVSLAEASSAAVIGPDLVGFCAVSGRSDGDRWQGALQGSVHPDHRRRGIGHELIRRAYEHAAIRRDAVDPRLPGSVTLWAEQGSPTTAQLAQDCGMQAERYYFRMERDLAAPIAVPPAPAGIAVRPFAAADDAGVHGASDASFADHWGSLPMSEEQWRDFMDSRQSRPGQSRVAVTADGLVVGFALCGEMVAETESHGYRTGWLERFGVLREYRGRGIAGAMLADTLLGLRAAGYARSQLMVDAASPTGAGRIYERLGYTVLDRHTVYRRELPVHEAGSAPRETVAASDGPVRPAALARSSPAGADPGSN